MTNNFQLNLTCRACSVATIANSTTWKETIIGHQLFFSQVCSSCTQSLYFWQDEQKNNYTQNKLHVVLHEPEIPGNVGAIIRLACAFDLTLHMIEPFGFIYSEKWLGRASAGHFSLTKQKLYASWADFVAQNSDGAFVFTSSHAKKSLNDFDFRLINKPIYLVFGRESKGLPPVITQQPQAINLKIPQTQLTSSINLAQAVAIATFFVRSQYQNFTFS